MTIALELIAQGCIVLMLAMGPYYRMNDQVDLVKTYPGFDCRADAIIPDHNGDAWSSVLRLKCEKIKRQNRGDDVRYHYENVYSLRRAVTKQCREPMPPMNEPPITSYRVPTGAQDQFDDSDSYLDPIYRETDPASTRPPLIVDGGAK